jgi:outer membrane protein assembly factor BamD
MKAIYAALVVASTLVPCVARAESSGADMHMNVARHYIANREHFGALNRLKIVLTQFQTSQYAEEALARIAELYLTLGADSEAQTAVAVLHRKFPSSSWSARARTALDTVTLAPAENEGSWISKAFK